jgi:hypothetical protein
MWDSRLVRQRLVIFSKSTYFRILGLNNWWISPHWRLTGAIISKAHYNDKYNWVQDCEGICPPQYSMKTKKQVNVDCIKKYG